MPLNALELTLADLVLPPTFGAGAGRMLPIPYEKQMLAQWCWAACATMVAVNGLTQCAIGRVKFPAAPCPPTSSEDFPATTADIQAALTKAGRVPTQMTGLPPVDALHIDADLAGGRPLQVGWVFPGRGHVVVIVGSQAGNGGATMYVVNDPDPTDGGAHQLLSQRDLDTARGLGSWSYAWRL